MLRINQEPGLEVRRRAVVVVTPWMPQLASGGPVGACYRLLSSLSRVPDLGADLYCLCTSPVRLFQIRWPEEMDLFATSEGRSSGFRHFRQRLIDATAYGSIRAVRDMFHAGFTVKEQLRRDALRQVCSDFLLSYPSSLFHAHLAVDVDRLVHTIGVECRERPRIILTEHSKGGMRREYVEQLGSASVHDRACVALDRWQESAIRAADIIVFPSSGAQELWEGNNSTLVPLASPKSLVIYNGVPRPKAITQAHERAGEMRLLAIAEHIHDKGIDRLMLGMARLREILPGRLLRLRIAGRATALTPKLDQMKADLELSEQVELLGTVPHDALIQEMADASFLVAMPRVVVFDLSILEAMALGKPILTTELPGNVEALGTKYPLYVNDEKEFARKISECDSDPRTAHEIGRSNLQRYEARFTSEAMASQHCKLYARLFESRAENLATVPQMNESRHLVSRRTFLYGGVAAASTGLVAAYLEVKGVLPGGEYHHLRRRLLLYSRPMRRVFEPGWEGSRAGWEKYSGNPVLGGSLGTCFDMCVLKEKDHRFRMWFSWRPRESIAITESRDGITWSLPTVVLRPTDKWGVQVNRPWVIKTDRGYEMWYTGQTTRESFIGHAVSQDGVEWMRTSTRPVIVPDQPWEGATVMCPSVIWDAAKQEYRMWYSGGEQYEPVAIGYATSADGVKWVKRSDPVFTHGRPGKFDAQRVGGGNVVERDGWCLMFYIGYGYETDAAIGLARSRDGITGWQRHPQNPIIGPGRWLTQWDSGSVYKPSALVDRDRWMLWYNACRSDLEQVGLAVHEGLDLGFGTA